MATVTITLTDRDDQVDVAFNFDPPLPCGEGEPTGAQILAGVALKALKDADEPEPTNG